MTLSEISYQGSKSRFMKVLKPLIENNLDEGMTYIEPFGGGMNSFTPINASKKIANDVNEYNIALWLLLKEQGFNGVETEWSEYLNILSNCEDKPNGPNYLQARALYSDMKKDCLSGGGKYPKALLGFVAYACSFGGGWWNGFIGYNEKKGENYVKEAIRGLKKHIDSAVNMENSDFLHGNYEGIEIPDNAFVYCDPPYANTKKYANDFDNERFWGWCRNLIETKENIKLLISEYNAPEDFVCIWSKGVQDSMGNNTMSKNEKLFIHNSQVSKFDLSSLTETISISRADIMEMVKKSVRRILKESNLDELEAWHGTTADFDRFDLSFLGTGEGTQVYGYGVYLTDVYDTGKWYAISTAYDKNKGKNKSYRADDKSIINGMYTLLYCVKNWDTGNIPIEEIKERVTKNFNSKKRGKNETVAYNYIMNASSSEEIENIIVKLKNEAAEQYVRYVYQVDIPDGPYIDWNETDQTFINTIFEQISQNFDTSFITRRKFNNFGVMFEKLRGWKHPKDKDANTIGIDQKDLSLFLYKLGYVGIKVRTGNKKGGDGRGMNLIVFDDNLVKITKQEKMGEVPSL